jgi:catechol 2,3-dioxygenase-like lactoylglutathione lyase family enzyme
VELVQEAASDSTVPAAGSITDIGLVITVNDLDKTLQVYRDVLGFSVSNPAANADALLRLLTGLSSATLRHARVVPPGSTLGIEFLEFKGVERTPLKLSIQDRGAARLQLRSQNIDALMDAMKAAGLTVVSEGGKAVPIPPNYKGALVADPNNFFFTPIEPCDNCAPTIAPVRQ